MIGSPLRAAWRTAACLAVTLPLMPVQAAAVTFGLQLARTLPRRYHRLCCRLFGIKIETRGAVSPKRPTLFVANHQSYFDISVLGAALEVSFVAKREVRGWPLFGWLARLQRTVFVERKSAAVAAERDELSRRLEEGSNLLLFAEGTSGDGTHLLPFKSALFSVAEREVHGRPLQVQPVSLSYTRLDGMPIGRQWRPFFAWYGDMDLMPHFWTALGLGRITVEIEFHPPVTIADFASRKALAAHCHRVVGHALAATRAASRPARSHGAAPAEALVSGSP